MASLAAALVAKLLSSESITDIVADRVYPQVAFLADRSYPMCVYKVDDITPTSTYGGPDRLTRCNVTIACVGRTYADADELAMTVVRELDGSASTWGTVEVQGCWLSDAGVTDDVITEPESEEIALYIRECDFDPVWFSNT